MGLLTLIGWVAFPHDAGTPSSAGKTLPGPVGSSELPRFHGLLGRLQRKECWPGCGDVGGCHKASWL